MWFYVLQDKRDTPWRYLKTTGGCLIEGGRLECDVMTPLSYQSLSLSLSVLIFLGVFPPCLCLCPSRLSHSCLIDTMFQSLSGRQSLWWWGKWGVGRVAFNMLSVVDVEIHCHPVAEFSSFRLEQLNTKSTFLSLRQSCERGGSLSGSGVWGAMRCLSEF